jgi:hypothetical protein
MNTQTKLYFSEVAERAIKEGEKHLYRFKIVGYGPVPEKPYNQGFWYIEPVAKPPRGARRIKLLMDAGVRIKGIVVAHEAKTDDFKINLPSIPNETWREIGEIALKVFLGMGLVVGFIALAFLNICLNDPAVIVILEDNTWLEVENYYE